MADTTEVIYADRDRCCDDRIVVMEPVGVQ